MNPRLREGSVERTGQVFERVSDQDAIGVFRVIPLQVDCLQVGLPDSETPGGTGYLGKEGGKGGKEGMTEERRKEEPDTEKTL